MAKQIQDMGATIDNLAKYLRLSASTPYALCVEGKVLGQNDRPSLAIPPRDREYVVKIRETDKVLTHGKQRQIIADLVNAFLTEVQPS
jgi:hypothetical protein